MACPRLLTALILATAFLADGALAQTPLAIAAPGEEIVATFRAEGAQWQRPPGRARGRFSFYATMLGGLRRTSPSCQSTKIMGPQETQNHAPLQASFHLAHYATNLASA